MMEMVTWNMYKFSASSFDRNTSNCEYKKPGRVEGIVKMVGRKRKVGGKRYKARSRGRSSPDTLAF